MPMIFLHPIARRLFSAEAGDTPAAGGGGASGGGNGQPSGSGNNAPQSGEVAFSAEQQAKINALLAAEKRKFQQSQAELQTKLTDFEKRVADADAAAAKAAEDAALAGKTEAEKFQHQFRKADERVKSLEGEISKVRAEYDLKLKAADDRRKDIVLRHFLAETLAAGAAERALSTAVREVRSSAEFEFDESGDAVVAVTLDGKRYEKREELSKAFYDSAPYLAKPPAGGSGTPRSGNGSVRSSQPHANAADAFSAALARR